MNNENSVNLEHDQVQRASRVPVGMPAVGKALKTSALSSSTPAVSEPPTVSRHLPHWKDGGQEPANAIPSVLCPPGRLPRPHRYPRFHHCWSPSSLFQSASSCSSTRCKQLLANRQPVSYDVANNVPRNPCKLP